MATMPVTFYQAKCDECGALFEGYADDGISAFEMRRGAEHAAADCGWLLEGRTYRRLTCPDCLRCEKCGGHPAWVGGSEYERHRLVLCDECEPPVLKAVTP